MHEHEHDEVGRLVRTVVTREVEWDDDEQALMLAWRMYQSLLHTCGHYLPKSTAPEAEYAYEVPEPTRCNACTAIAQTVEAFKGAPHPQALLFHAERRR